MNVTIAVAIITSLSTLSGGLIAGFVSLQSQKRQIAAQAELATIERKYNRVQQHADSRKQTYVQFLNKVNDVERLLEKCWLEECKSSPQEKRATEASVNAYEASVDLERGAFF